MPTGLSEAHAGSDPAAMRTLAGRDGDEYVIGAKAWVTHGDAANFYDVMARTYEDGSRGIFCSSSPQLVATDNAMKVTTEAVQVFGGAGYAKDFPVGCYMREIKVMQIFEGINQIRRLVLGRSLAR